MSFTFNKNTPSKLTNKLSKSNLLSPKSASTYIKEFKEEENVKKKQEDSSSPKRRTNEDPTQLNIILNALKCSSKGNIPYLQPSEGTLQADVDEVCDFKNVGDLSSISFSEENSFREALSEEETDEGTNKENYVEINQHSRLDEERSESDEDLANLSNLSLQVLMGQIQLEQDRVNETQTRCFKIREAYLQKLLEIRGMALQNLSHFRSELQQIQVLEQERLEQMQYAVDRETNLIEKTYMEKVEQRKEEIEKEMEEVNLEEARKESRLKELIHSLEQPLVTFRNKLNVVQSEAVHLSEESELHKIVFQELPSILEATKQAVAQMSSTTTTDREINAAAQRMADAIKILEDIQRLLYQSRQQNSLNKEAAPQPVLTSSNESAVAPQTEVTQALPSSQGATGSLPSEQQFAEPSQPSEPQQDKGDITPSPESNIRESKSHFDAAETTYLALKAKFNQVSVEANEVRENIHLRPLLARIVGIVNTFNNEKHDSSNRGKLQQILNLVNGRTCNVGSDTISTRSNSSAQAFVKEQLASCIVTLSHDKQVASMAIYASLIVRLWQFHPEMGELILSKLYETCPFLVPLAIKRDPSQTEEEFHRSLGFRHKEGGTQEAVDKYLTRMGAAAQLYGRIVSIQVENHPYGIQEGWKWLARTLSLPPYPSVTAALLSGFLSVAGAPLLNHYGKQFRKLLRFLCTSYLPQIEKEVLEGGHSDIMGLKNFLKEYQKTNVMPQSAEGYKLLL